MDFWLAVTVIVSNADCSATEKKIVPMDLMKILAVSSLQTNLLNCLIKQQQANEQKNTYINERSANILLFTFGKHVN